MEVVDMVFLLIALVFVLTIPVWVTSLYGFSPRKKKPETLELEFLKKYNSKKEIVVNEDELEKIRRYTSTGWIELGLGKESQLTARLTERGRKLLRNY